MTCPRSVRCAWLRSLRRSRLRSARDNHILVAQQDGRVVGVIELKEGRHLAMLFVDPACQGQGIGHALFEAVLPQVREPVLTVRASLNAVPTYLRYGFALDGDVGEFNGLVYQQMVRAAA